MDSRVGVHGQTDADSRIDRLVHSAEGEAQLRQTLVLDPLRGDGPHLRLDPPRLVGERPKAQLDALFGRLVHRGADVLPRLSLELQGRQVDHCLLGDLDRVPAHVRRVAGRLRGHGEQAGHEPGRVDVVGEGAQQVRALRLRSRDWVTQPDGHACMDAIGDVSRGRLPLEPAVLRPRRHPRKVVDRAHLLQQAGGDVAFVLAGGRGQAARHSTRAARRRVTEGTAPEDEDGETKGVAHEVVESRRQSRLAVEDHHHEADDLNEHDQGKQRERPAPGPAPALVKASGQPQPKNRLDERADDVAV